MGLDMYLTKKTFLWSGDKDKIKIIGNNNIRNDRISEITEEIGYWRKANAIHNWFVKNVQEGNDDCKDWYVEEEKLKELLKLVNKVLDNNSLAEKLLPNVGGFFFGSTDYNEYYFEDLKNTKKIITEALNEEEGDIYYRSSW